MLVLGFVAQGLFTARFLVQWIVSEKEGRSVVPLAFWYLSVGGGGLLLLYAIFRRDPVFILGQAGGLVVYIRNLYLIYRERRQGKAAAPADPPDGGAACEGEKERLLGEDRP